MKTSLWRAIQERFYGQPESAVPWLCAGLASAVGAVTRSPGWALATLALTQGAWRSVSPYLVIDDLRLGPVLLCCPPYDEQGRPQLWLTFDDGPGPETMAVLDHLERCGARATFFFVASRVPGYPHLERLAERLLRGGHSVGNHSWSHPNFLKLSEPQAREEVEQARETLRRIFPDTLVPLFRPPFGYRTPALLQAITAAGEQTVGWSLNSLDFLEGSPTALAQRVKERLKPGAIALFHDGPERRQRTVSALPNLLGELEAQGFTTFCPRRAR